MSLGDMVVNVIEFVVETIEAVFRITFPIGWDELGVIATVLAVVVALVANKKASEQLKSALEMQEQSKNVGLLDKRVELAEAIQSGKSVSEMTLRVLFNDEIVKHYKAWKNYLTKKVYAEHDLDRFYAEFRESDGAGGYITGAKDKFEKFMSDMSRPDCPQQVFDDYEKYCSHHVIYLPYGEDGKSIPYNHSVITNRISDAIVNAKKEQKLTLELAEKYISNSIKQIETKPSKSLILPWRKKKVEEKPDGND